MNQTSTSSAPVESTEPPAIDAISPPADLTPEVPAVVPADNAPAPEPPVEKPAAEVKTPKTKEKPQKPKAEPQPEPTFNIVVDGVIATDPDGKAFEFSEADAQKRINGMQITRPRDNYEIKPAK